MFHFCRCGASERIKVVVGNWIKSERKVKRSPSCLLPVTTMTETDPKTPSSTVPTSSSSSSSSSSDVSNDGSKKLSGHKSHYNPPETVNPDAATLRDQWRFAIKQYSKWYSHAWGTAILAGAAFFALGWFIKGGNPLPSSRSQDPSHPSSSDAEKPRR